MQVESEREREGLRVSAEWLKRGERSNARNARDRTKASVRIKEVYLYPALSLSFAEYTLNVMDVDSNVFFFVFFYFFSAQRCSAN